MRITPRCKKKYKNIGIFWGAAVTCSVAYVGPKEGEGGGGGVREELHNIEWALEKI